MAVSISLFRSLYCFSLSVITVETPTELNPWMLTSRSRHNKSLKLPYGGFSIKSGKNTYDD